MFAFWKLTHPLLTMKFSLTTKTSDNKGHYFENLNPKRIKIKKNTSLLISLHYFTDHSWVSFMGRQMDGQRDRQTDRPKQRYAWTTEPLQKGSSNEGSHRYFCWKMRIIIPKSPHDLAHGLYENLRSLWYNRDIILLLRKTNNA